MAGTAHCWATDLIPFLFLYPGGISAAVLMVFIFEALVYLIDRVDVRSLFGFLAVLYAVFFMFIDAFTRSLIRREGPT